MKSNHGKIRSLLCLSQLPRRNERIQRPVLLSSFPLVAFLITTLIVTAYISCASFRLIDPLILLLHVNIFSYFQVSYSGICTVCAFSWTFACIIEESPPCPIQHSRIVSVEIDRVSFLDAFYTDSSAFWEIEYRLWIRLQAINISFSTITLNDTTCSPLVLNWRLPWLIYIFDWIILELWDKVTDKRSLLVGLLWKCDWRIAPVELGVECRTR